MKLYSSPISPYAARCRMQIAYKQLPVEIIAPPGGMSSDAVKAVNPPGRIPVLNMGERCIAESWAIMNYLESRFPNIPMRPSEPYAQAKLEERVRFVDIYLAPAMFPLFRALRGGVDDAAIQTALQGLKDQLAMLDELLAQAASENPDLPDFTLADAALLPVIWYARILARYYGEPDCLAAAPQVTAWWEQQSKQAAAAHVLKEMDDALRVAIPPLFA